MLKHFPLTMLLKQWPCGSFSFTSCWQVNHDISLTTAQPTIVDLPSPPTHTEGDYFELVCTFTGVPAPDIRWERDGSLFLFGEGRRVINSIGRSQLVINSSALSDAGVYSCSVSNVAGTAARSVRLEVRGEGVSWKWSVHDTVTSSQYPLLLQPCHQHVSCTLTDVL